MARNIGVNADYAAAFCKKLITGECTVIKRCEKILCRKRKYSHHLNAGSMTIITAHIIKQDTEYYDGTKKDRI